MGVLGTEFLWTLIKFVIMIIAITGGVLLGMFLRKKKSAKEETTVQEEK